MAPATRTLEQLRPGDLVTSIDGFDLAFPRRVADPLGVVAGGRSRGVRLERTTLTEAYLYADQTELVTIDDTAPPAPQPEPEAAPEPEPAEEAAPAPQAAVTRVPLTMPLLARGRYVLRRQASLSAIQRRVLAESGQAGGAVSLRVNGTTAAGLEKRGLVYWTGEVKRRPGVSTRVREFRLTEDGRAAAAVLNEEPTGRK